MLHKDTLTALCHGRDLLRQIGETDLSVRQIAMELGMSQFHFIRLFKAVFGETPKQCQMRARLERAKRLLMLTETSVTDICMEVGFSSLGSFTALFGRRVGVTPTAFRVTTRPLVATPGQLPKHLIPGCFSLMG
jgi:AraC-like DNA-binding protein